MRNSAFPKKGCAEQEGAIPEKDQKPSFHKSKLLESVIDNKE
jgi:hypothetical protein